MHHARYPSEIIHVRQSEREQQRDHQSDALEFFHVNSHKPFSGPSSQNQWYTPPIQERPQTESALPVVGIKEADRIAEPIHARHSGHYSGEVSLTQCGC